MVYSLKKAVFWDVAPCRSGVNRRFIVTAVKTSNLTWYIPCTGHFLNTQSYTALTKLEIITSYHKPTTGYCR
jgi:hypothetical protein